jgi:hypothetical protein
VALISAVFLSNIGSVGYFWLGKKKIKAVTSMISSKSAKSEIDKTVGTEELKSSIFA